MDKQYIEKIKRSYISVVSVVVNCLTLIFYGVLYYYGNLSNSLPIYIYIFIAFWVITNITLFIQERSKTTKTSHSNILKYLLLNIICGFSITLAFSTIYVFGAIANGYEVFNYWLLIAGSTLLSFIGTHIFFCSEFEISKHFSNNFYNLLGILVKVCSFISLIYISLIVPVTQQENNFIWLSILILLAIDSLLIRPYFNYGLYLFNIREKEKNS
ncbi:DUF5079 domain-containing protein [Staphylococcus pasteuri]|uniref:DUF5079 family protein n=1 Tax=Staphylococcus pasteuri TaxID=45972 RepID=UPI000D3A75C6|nr:DUF5079 family protein [Staphylococcus pasteuri]MCE3022114.1 DUF5079 family protein [Staphylococcus pasteuri]PTU84502.1 DUF5079 domain-containing protein [Staphylococcus pasteuri]